MNTYFTIPNDLYDRDLLCHLNPNRFDDNCAKAQIELLHKISFCRISDFGREEHIDNIALTEDEYSIIIDNDWQNHPNLEIKARCCDLLKKKEGDKRKLTINASNAYLEVYRLTEEIDYLERAISIRNFKQVNNDEFLQIILNEILNKTIQYPFWLANIVKVLVKSYSADKLSRIRNDVETCIREAKKSKTHHAERQYIDVLFLLKSISKQESYKLKALSFESEADNIWHNQEKNTFYPNLPQLYHNAYKEIAEIKLAEPEIRQRIKEKLIQANTYFAEILSKAGIRIEMPFGEDEKKKIDQWVANDKWKYSIDFISFLRNIPFASKDNIDKYISISRKGSIISSMMNTSRLDNKGNTIGIDNPENSLRTEAHIYFRQKILYTLWSSVKKANCMDLNIEDSLLYYLMERNKPCFLHDEDRLLLWIKGFMAGFEEDFISASHILMPQIENALRTIAEIHHGSLVKLEEERQDEATLGSIFKQLENILAEATRFEMESFLQSGIDVNFRNKLSHGLLSSFEVTQYGVYLWWLGLKLYFDLDSLLLSEIKTL